MAPDVAALNLREPDLDSTQPYEDGGPKSFAPPNEGRYTVKVPMIGDGSFGSTNDGFLTCQTGPLTILDPGAANGYQIKYNTISLKKYPWRNGNSVTDFLRACGYPMVPKTNAEAMAALKAVSGKTCQIGLQWRAWNGDDRIATKGQKNFPVDPHHPELRQPFIESESLTDDQGRAKRYWANANVSYYVSALKSN